MADNFNLNDYYKKSAEYVAGFVTPYKSDKKFIDALAILKSTTNSQIGYSHLFDPTIFNQSFSKRLDATKTASYLINFGFELTKNPYGGNAIRQTLVELNNISQDVIFSSLNTFDSINDRDGAFFRDTGSSPRNVTEENAKLTSKTNPQFDTDTNNAKWKSGILAQVTGPEYVFHKPLGQQAQNILSISKIVNTVLAGTTQDENEFSLKTKNLADQMNAGSIYWPTKKNSFTTDSPYDMAVKDIETWVAYDPKSLSIVEKFREANINKTIDPVTPTTPLGSSLKLTEYNSIHKIITTNPNALRGVETQVSSGEEFDKYITNFISGNDNTGQPLKDKHVFPFVIELYGTKTFKKGLLLYPHLESFNTDLTPTWDSYSFYGRTEDVWNYQQTNKTLNLDFILYMSGSNDNELKMFGKRIEYLTQMCYPKFQDEQDIRKRLPPLLRLSLGDVYFRQPGFFTSLSIDWLTDSPVWDLRYSSTLKIRMPRMVRVSMSYQIIHEEQPSTDTTFYGWNA